MEYLLKLSDLSVENINTLQNLSEEFIHYISNHSDKNDIQYTVTKIIETIFNDDFITDTNIDCIVERIVNSLKTIKSISNCPVGIWESDSIQQKRIESTLGNLLLKTLENNYHSVVKDCQSFNETLKTCNYLNPLIPNTKQHLFTCNFHLHDSLSVHLVLACIHNGLSAISVDKNLDDTSLMKVMLFGLYHDIGKPLSVEAFEHKKSMMTGFPAHAEVGAMLFQSHHSPKMNEHISINDYMQVCYAILRHMCGYHGDNNTSNKYKRSLLMLEQKDVLELLIANRVGDHFGKIPDLTDPLINSETSEHFINEQIVFQDQMRKDIDFNLPEILTNNTNKNGSINPNKIVIYLIGTSGAGKTYLLNKIINTYVNNVSYISRDECIAEICVGKCVRFEGLDYTLMYSIYEAGKKLSALSRQTNPKRNNNNNNNNKVNNISSSDIINGKKVLANAQKQWNDYISSDKASDIAKSCLPISLCDPSSSTDPDINGRVQKLYEKKIRDAINDDNIFLVMDTFMNCFPSAIENNVPHELNKCFRVHIHVQSYLERKTTTVSKSIADQLKISGPYGLSRPLHPDGFKLGKDKKSFASLSSEIGTVGPLPKSTFSSKFRPHLVYICTRTENGDYGYTEMFDSIDTLVSKMSKKIIHTTDTQIISKHNSVSMFGVDPLTKDMNVLEFYRYLMKEFNGNRSLIKKFLGNLGKPNRGLCGFIHNPFIKKDYDLMNNDEKLAYCKSLSDLSIEWKNNGVVTKSYSVSDFNDNCESSYELREAYSQSIITLKYFDQVGARYWQNVWAKEMRGTTLFINPETNEVDIISFKLPRGAEAVTGMIKKKGINTQDIISRKIDILDDEQKDTCEKLCSTNSMDINMHLTSKSDGSLCVINVYTGKAISIMLPIVNIYGCDYIRLWAKQSLSSSDGKRLILPTTQGSVFLTDYMARYMTTSILCGSDIVTRQQLSELNNNYIEAWEKYGENWLSKFLTLKFFDDLTLTHTFIFEAICKNRQGLFNDHEHIELACTYNVDRLVFLGVSIVDCRFFVSHTVYNDSAEIPFEQPLWWKITKSDQVNSMIDDMDNLIMGKITKSDYLIKYPPSNKDINLTNVDSINIDYEGWVGMKFASYKSLDNDHIKVMNKYNIPLTIYSKIKTESYYRAHKFNVDNIPYLLELAKTSGHVFPLASRVNEVCKSGALVDRLTRIGEQVMLLLDFNDPDNVLLKKLHDIYTNNINAIQNSGDSDVKLPRNPLEDFDKHSFEIKCKIVTNYKGMDFVEYLYPIYVNIFPELKLKLNDKDIQSVKFIIFGLTMNLKPWMPGYLDRIKDINVKHSAVKGLVNACIEDTVY